MPAEHTGRHTDLVPGEAQQVLQHGPGLGEDPGRGVLTQRDLVLTQLAVQASWLLPGELYLSVASRALDLPHRRGGRSWSRPEGESWTGQAGLTGFWTVSIDFYRCSWVLVDEDLILSKFIEIMNFVPFSVP